METLITRVADEVSRRLSPAEVSSTPSPSPLSTLQEVPVSSPVGQNTAEVASTVVQQSLVNASTALTGLIPQNSASNPMPGQLFHSVSLPVDARLSEKIPAKIWKDEYVDFGSLLANPVLVDQYQITINNSDSSFTPSLCLEPLAKHKKVTTIETWLSSFHVFVGAYTKQFPHEVPALMKYGEIIQDLAGRGHNWKFYDENFRFLRQTHHAALPWDRIHGELWLKSQVSLRRPLQKSAPPPKGKADFVPKGYCFKFHKDRKCLPSCTFKHLCYRCEGSHPISKCNFRGSSKIASLQSRTAKSSQRHPSLPTPVKVERLGFLFEGYTPSTVEFLLFGFTQGFPVHFQVDRKSRTASNLMSALDSPEAVDAKLQKELESHRLAGPFQSPPLSPFWVSPLGLVPKKVQGEFRLIHHLSFPPGLSVNDGISSDHTSVNYATIDEAIQLIKSASPGCFLAKTDIKNAFRIIPIHPDDYGLLGMQWRGLYYYDRCMPMACSSSCLTFETFSTAVEWIARNKLKIDYILHILDDYLLVAPTEQLCQ